jgi:hypothetical protein
MNSDRVELSADGTSLRKLPAIGLAAFMTALGAGMATLCLEWWGGSATHGDVEKKVEPVETKNEALEKQIAKLQLDLDDLKFAQRGAREMLVLEIRDRVSLEAALRVAVDPRKRETAKRKALEVGARYDVLILQQKPPHEAAKTALDELAPQL